AQGVNALAFTSDGRRLASAGHDGHVRTWSGTGGQETVALPAARGSEALAFGKGGKLLATAGGPASGPGEVRLWKLDGISRYQHSLDLPAAAVALAMNTDATLLAAACDGKQVRRVAGP